MRVSASTTAASLFEGATSANAVFQSHTLSGAIEYRSEIRITAEQMLTAQDDITAFEETHLKGIAGLPIDQRNQTIRGADGNNITFDFNVRYSIRHNMTDTHSTISLRIIFGNYLSYVKYHELTLANAPLERSLFFIERTTRFNAYTRFFDVNGPSARTANIISEFNIKFDQSETPRTEYLFVLFESTRRSNTNATERTSDFPNYNYYFKVAETLDNYVEIFDRRANTPMWYGVAVGATLIVMGLLYIYLKSDAAIKADDAKKKAMQAGESTQGQYPYHGN